MPNTPYITGWDSDNHDFYIEVALDWEADDEALQVTSVQLLLIETYDSEGNTTERRERGDIPDRELATYEALLNDTVQARMRDPKDGLIDDIGLHASNPSHSFSVSVCGRTRYDKPPI